MCGSFCLREARAPQRCHPGLQKLARTHHFPWATPVSFAAVLAAWYGPDWRRVAPPALGRSRRTLYRWTARDGLVPRWAWLQFVPDRAQQKWRTIDRWTREQHAATDAAAMRQKSEVHRTARLVEDRLRSSSSRELAR
jgi:hypothetical protein